MGSLNASRKRNALSPSCASGRSSKDAVSGGGPVSGPSTVVEIPSDSERPSAVQIAPSSSHGRPASRLTVTSPSESGSISNSHTTSRSCCPALRLPIERVPAPPGALPPTGLTDVTAPPSTSTPSAPTFSGASLNSTRTLIRFSPSWRSGGETKRAPSALPRLVRGAVFVSDHSLKPSPLNACTRTSYLTPGSRSVRFTLVGGLFAASLSGAARAGIGLLSSC